MSVRERHVGKIVLLWATWAIWFWVVAQSPQFKYGTHSLFWLACVLLWVWYRWCREEE